jgi:hypothetical protein
MKDQTKRKSIERGFMMQSEGGDAKTMRKGM